MKKKIFAVWVGPPRISLSGREEVRFGQTGEVLPLKKVAISDFYAHGHSESVPAQPHEFRITNE